MLLHRKPGLYQSRTPSPYSRIAMDGGFTLLELLIALAILAVLLTVVTATFGAALRTMTIFDMRSKVFHSSRVAFSLLNDELHSIALPTSLQKANFVGNPDAIQERTADRLSFDSSNFRRFPGSPLGTNPVTIDWWVEDKAIFHRESPTIPGIFKPIDFVLRANLDTRADFMSGAFPLSQTVKNFRLRFSQGSQWIRQWSSLEKGTLPQAVSIELTLKLPGSRDQIFSTFIRLPRGHQEAY